MVPEARLSSAWCLLAGQSDARQSVGPPWLIYHLWVGDKDNLVLSAVPRVVGGRGPEVREEEGEGWDSLTGALELCCFGGTQGFYLKQQELDSLE